jgi:transcriptional regulator with XRE-family HTH domain
MAAIRLRIYDLRKAGQMSQKELADGVGVSVQTVSKWENNVCMPDIALLPDIAKFFRVTVDELLGVARPSSWQRCCMKGWSICSEPEWATAHIRNGIFFADQKYYQSMSRGDMAAICETLQTLGDIKVLKTLYELTVADFENLYASPEEIARRARLPEETVRQCLQLLWVQEHELNEGLYRLQGPYMHLPALLQMFLEA